MSKMFHRLFQNKSSLSFKGVLRNYSKKTIKVSGNPQRDAEILRGVEEAIRTQKLEKQPLSLVTRIGLFLIPTTILITGVVGYNAYHGLETYIPLLFHTKLLVNEDNSYGINVEKLKQLTTTRLIQKLTINQKFQNLVGLPITSHEVEKFDVYLEYKSLMSSGVEINPNKKPHLSWVSRQYSINHSKLNEFLEPMGISDPDFQFQVVNNPSSSIREYRIIIDGRFKINGNELFKTAGRNCDLNFKGILDFDHSQNIKFEAVSLIYRDPDNQVKVERLW